MVMSNTKVVNIKPKACHGDVYVEMLEEKDGKS